MAKETQTRSVLDELNNGETVIEASGSGKGESAPLVEGPGSDASAAGAAASENFRGYADDDFALPEPSEAEGGNTDFGGGSSGDFAEGGSDDVRRDTLGRDLSKGRGPKPGSRKAASSVGLIERLLLGIHTMAASALKSPHWELSADEANELAKAAAKVQEQYDISLDPKTEAWLGLATVAGAMYAPRVMVTLHLASEKAKASKPPPAERPLPGGGNFSAPGSSPNQSNGRADGAVTPSQIYGVGFNGMVKPN